MLTNDAWRDRWLPPATEFEVEAGQIYDDAKRQELIQQGKTLTLGLERK